MSITYQPLKLWNYACGGREVLHLSISQSVGGEIIPIPLPEDPEGNHLQITGPLELSIVKDQQEFEQNFLYIEGIFGDKIQRIYATYIDGDPEFLYAAPTQEFDALKRVCKYSTTRECLDFAPVECEDPIEPGRTDTIAATLVSGGLVIGVMDDGGFEGDGGPGN
ncbi:MAG: hypothetical protein AAF570_00845 [Bacteroidota bacterium]